MMNPYFDSVLFGPAGLGQNRYLGGLIGLVRFGNIAPDSGELLVLPIRSFWNRRKFTFTDGVSSMFGRTSVPSYSSIRTFQIKFE